MYNYKSTFLSKARRNPLLLFFVLYAGIIVFIFLAATIGDRWGRLRAARNKINLTIPDVIGQTEDGKTVLRYYLIDPDGHKSYIYRIKGEPGFVR